MTVCSIILYGQVMPYYLDSIHVMAVFSTMPIDNVLKWNNELTEQCSRVCVKRTQNEKTEEVSEKSNESSSFIHGHVLKVYIMFGITKAQHSKLFGILS